jgi:hypothetical protein
MHSEPSRFVRAMTTAVCAAALSTSAAFCAPAPEHLVTPDQLQQSTLHASQTRQRKVEELREILSTPQAEKAFEKARVNPEEVKKAISGLSDQELAQLSERATKAQRDFAAGGISADLLILILVGIILVIVFVAYA